MQGGLPGPNDPNDDEETQGKRFKDIIDSLYWDDNSERDEEEEREDQE